MKTFIIGGGSSVTLEVYKAIQEHREGNEVIAVNNAWRYIHPDVLVFIDRVLFEDTDSPKRHRLFFPTRKVYSELTCEKYCRFPVDNSENVIFPSSKLDVTRSTKNGVYFGNKAMTSGIAALSIALMLGRDDIYLFGYDGGVIDGKSHHHHKYLFNRYETANSEYKEFENHAGKITNCSPRSKIETFKKKDFREIFG